MSLRSLGVLDTPAEERFDRLTRLAQRLFAVPYATISFIDERREWVKSAASFPHAQLAREVSFAAHVIGEGEPVVIEDTARDHRFWDHPLVTGDLRIRFFAGYPLRAKDGSFAGAITLLDTKERLFTPVERQSLGDLAAIAERELREVGLSASQLEIISISSRDASRIDPLTRLWNRSAMFDIIRREIEHARADQSGVALLLVDIDRMRQINEQTGHAKGDWLLSEVARVLRRSLRPTDVLARFAGEEFAAFLTGVESTHTVDAADRIRLMIAREVLATGGREMSVTVGAATAPALEADPDLLVRTAQSALWIAKKRGGNCVSVSPVQEQLNSGSALSQP
ncbi:MAG TPA: sensor domain-containing diguanylate cyclase [Thermoanaerobaculia bacterium]|nr:sensor domain-containing diguanylate cyclase [Thermoanaerobaculia bacterium]